MNSFNFLQEDTQVQNGREDKMSNWLIQAGLENGCSYIV